MALSKCLQIRAVNPQVPGSSPGRGAIKSRSWQVLRSKIFAELFRKAARNHGAGQAAVSRPDAGEPRGDDPGNATLGVVSGRSYLKVEPAPRSQPKGDQIGPVWRAIKSRSWQVLRSKIFAELLRKAARNDGTGQSKQPRCALRRGAPAHHVCARRLRIFLAERSYASTRNLGMVRAQGRSSAWTARITNIRARSHEADRVLASALNVACG